MIQASHDVGGGRSAAESTAESAGPIRSQFAGDPEMREIISLFVAEVPDRLCTLRSAWAAGDGDRMRSLAHQLKGAAGGYGFPDLGAAAAKLETSLATPPEHGLSGSQAAFDRVIDLLSRMAQAA